MKEYAEVIPLTVSFENLPDKFPMYPGGYIGLLGYIKENTKYPVGPREREIEGKILIEYSIDIDGSVCDLNVISGIDDELDNEIVRVLKSIDEWIPAHQNNEPIKFQLSQSVYYKL